MFHLKDKLSFKSPLSLFVYHTAVSLLLTRSCEARLQVIGPSQPVVATLGDVITLPCHLEPSVDASDMTIEWTRPDLNPRFVFVFRDGAQLQSKTHPSYRGRTMLSVDQLKHGDVSLRLSRVQLSDEGTYRCFIPRLWIEASVDLVVRSVPSPVTMDVDRGVDGMMLDCNSAGWYPEPEVLWLDAEGNIVSAGPTETLRGPDGLYTVSSSVTVDNKLSNTFTCKLQHKYTNQTAVIYFHDDFSVALPPAVPGIIGAVVGFGLGGLVVWLVVKRWRRNRIAAENDLKQGEKMNKRIGRDAEAPSAMGEARETKPLLMGSRKREEELKSMRSVFMEQKSELENQKVNLNKQREEEERHRGQTEMKIQPVGKWYLWSPELKNYFLNEVRENLEWRKSELEKQQQNTEKLLSTIYKAEGINAEEQEDQTNNHPLETRNSNKKTTVDAEVHLKNSQYQFEHKPASI